MQRRSVVLAALAVALLPAAALAATKQATAEVHSVTEVLARNAAARGGLDAWRKVDRMVWLGHVEPGMDIEEGATPKFAMHMARPNKTRFEVKTKRSDFTRIFDGSHGWRTHPDKDGRPVVTTFPKAEVDYARGEFVIDGPLLDAAAKGVKVSLDGIDTVDGTRAYRLSLTLPEGGQRKVWIDTKTNLEFRIDRPIGTGTDPNRPLAMYYRDWSAEDGLVVPHVIETTMMQGETVVEARRDRLVIESVLINPPLDAETFSMPSSPMRRNTKTIIPMNTATPGEMQRSK